MDVYMLKVVYNVGNSHSNGCKPVRWVRGSGVHAACLMFACIGLTNKCFIRKNEGVLPRSISYNSLYSVKFLIFNIGWLKYCRHMFDNFSINWLTYFFITWLKFWFYLCYTVLGKSLTEESFTFVIFPIFFPS